MNFVVYRMFDQSGHALYVGCSDAPMGRLGRHYNKGLRPERVTFTYHTTLQQALDVERAEIARLSPIENIRSTGQKIPKAPQGGAIIKVARAIAALGNCTSSDVLLHDPTIAVGTAATIMLRLRAAGQIEIVGTKPNGYRKGRPSYIVAPTPALIEMVAQDDAEIAAVAEFRKTMAEQAAA